MVTDFVEAPMSEDVGTRAQARDEFRALFEAAYGPVVRTVWLVVHDRALAEEVAQDAFVELYRHWCSVRHYERPTSGYAGWRSAVLNARRPHPAAYSSSNAWPPPIPPGRTPDDRRRGRRAPRRRAAGRHPHAARPGSARSSSSSTWRTDRWTRSPISSAARRRPGSSTCTTRGTASRTSWERRSMAMSIDRRIREGLTRIDQELPPPTSTPPTRPSSAKAVV